MGNEDRCPPEASARDTPASEDRKKEPIQQKHNEQEQSVMLEEVLEQVHFVPWRPSDKNKKTKCFKK